MTAGPQGVAKQDTAAANRQNTPKPSFPQTFGIPAPYHVIPAKAGIQRGGEAGQDNKHTWSNAGDAPKANILPLHFVDVSKHIRNPK